MSTYNLLGYGYQYGFKIGNFDHPSAVQPTAPFVPAQVTPVPASPPLPPHLQFSANIIGATIPLAIGNVRLAGQIGWAEGLTATSDALDSSYLTFATFYCEPIDKTEAVHIKRMWANGTLFYDLTLGGMVIPASMSGTQNAVDLRDAISSMRIYQGSDTQEPDPTIVLDEGAENVPAFRKLRYVVFRNFPLFIANNSVPNISIEWERDDFATLNVSDIIVALGACRGIRIDVSGVTATRPGFVCSSQETVVQSLIKHKDEFNYQVTDGDPISLPVKVISRLVNDDLVVDLDVTQDELVRNGQAPSITFERIEPTEMPAGLDIQYTDAGHSFDTLTQPARYDGTSVASSIMSIASDYVTDATTARQTAFEILFRIMSRALSMVYEITDIRPEIGDVIRVTRATGDTGLGDVFTTLVEQQTWTKSRTLQIVATALLTSTGITVAGGDPGDVGAGRLWPEDCITDPTYVESGRIWSAAASTGVYSVNNVPSPYRKLARSRSYVIDGVGDVTYIGADAGYVYHLTDAAKIVRINKSDHLDYTILETQDAPVNGPVQFVIDNNTMYFATDGDGTSGFRATRLWTVDLSNFTTSGVSFVEIVDHTVTTRAPLGICIVGTQLLLSTTTANVLYGTLPISTFMSAVTGDADHTLGRASSDGTYGYFAPYPHVSHLTTLMGRVTPGSPPTVDYFDITDDPNVASVGGAGLLPDVCSDGTNVCFVVRSTDDTSYVARRTLGTLAWTTGIDVAAYIPNTPDAPSYFFYSVHFDGGYYYINGFGALIAVNATTLVGEFFPPTVWFPPTNDNFANAQAITAPTTINGNYGQATKEVGETDWGATANSHSVWYLFTPAATGDYTLEITASTNAKLAVFTGDTVDALSLVDLVEANATPLVVTLTSGTRYYITLDAKGPTIFTLSDFTVTLSDVAP